MKNIFDKDTLLHLRLPFSFFLLPVFCFGLSQAEQPDPYNTLVIFIALHFFLYPASNSYNSYMDKDKGSIGALRNPPPVTKKLYHASIILDCAGLALAALLHWKMILLMTLYIAVSKAYSWHGIRLKKHAVTGWLVVMLFQGGYTYLLVNMCARANFSAAWFTAGNLQAMLLSSLLIGGFYPLTQIYQHDEDSERGDLTISYKLGVKGTFIFCALIFLLAFALSAFIFSRTHFIVFASCLVPVTGYFIAWAVHAFRDARRASYSGAMHIAFLSSLCMTTCFILHFALR